MLYKIFNGPAPTTAAQVAVATGTSIKTLLQIKPGPRVVARVKEWGISFNGSAAATPGRVELCVTDVAATVTAHVAAGIHKIDSRALAAGDPTTDAFEVGTTATGYTSSGEGSIAAVRQLDVQFIAPTNQYIFQCPLGLEFIINPGEFGRVRVHFGASVDAVTYVLLEI
jgi:FlaG/FlaF family flagellin (archaellin)